MSYCSSDNTYFDGAIKGPRTHNRKEVKKGPKKCRFINYMHR